MLDLSKYMTRPFSRCNCADLLRWFWSDQGVEIPPFAIQPDQGKQIDEAVATQRRFWKRIEEPVTPCLVLMRNDDHDPGLCNHFGIYANGEVLHTTRKTGPARFNLDHPWWGSRIEGFYVPR